MSDLLDLKSAVMVDVETLGTGVNAVVTQIAAVFFDPATGRVGKSFDSELSVQDQLERGRSVDAATLKWYVDEDIPMGGLCPTLPGVYDVLSNFTAWLKAEAADVDRLELWCKGPDFDFALLRGLYAQFHLEEPWRFSNQRDVRTVVAMAKARGVVVVEVPVSHDALEDCEVQVGLVRQVMQPVTGGRSTQLFYESVDLAFGGNGRPWEEIAGDMQAMWGEATAMFLRGCSAQKSITP